MRLRQEVQLLLLLGFFLAANFQDITLVPMFRSLAPDFPLALLLIFVSITSDKFRCVANGHI